MAETLVETSAVVATPDPWKNIVNEMAVSAIIQKHSSVSTTVASCSVSTIVRSVIVPSTNSNQVTQFVNSEPASPTPPSSSSFSSSSPSSITTTQIASGMMQQGYIAVNSLTSQATGTNVPILAQGMTGLQGTHIALPQLVSGHLQTSDLTTQTPVVHLAPMGYAPGTAVDGTQILQSAAGFWYGDLKILWLTMYIDSCAGILVGSWYHTTKCNTVL